MKQAKDVMKTHAVKIKNKEVEANTQSLKVILKRCGRQLKKAQSTIRFQKTKESDSEDEYDDDDDDEFEEEIDEALQNKAMQTFEAAKNVIADLERQISSLSSTSSAAIAQPEQSKFIFANSRDFLQKLNEMQQMRGRRNSDRCVCFCVVVVAAVVVIALTPFQRFGVRFPLLTICYSSLAAISYCRNCSACDRRRADK